MQQNYFHSILLMNNFNIYNTMHINMFNVYYIYIYLLIIAFNLT